MESGNKGQDSRKGTFESSHSDNGLLKAHSDDQTPITTSETNMTDSQQDGTVEAHSSEPNTSTMSFSALEPGREEATVVALPVPDQVASAHSERPTQDPLNSSSTEPGREEVTAVALPVPERVAFAHSERPIQDPLNSSSTAHQGDTQGSCVSECPMIQSMRRNARQTPTSNRRSKVLGQPPEPLRIDTLRRQFWYSNWSPTRTTQTNASSSDNNPKSPDETSAPRNRPQARSTPKELSLAITNALWESKIPCNTWAYGEQEKSLYDIPLSEDEVRSGAQSIWKIFEKVTDTIFKFGIKEGEMDKHVVLQTVSVYLACLDRHLRIILYLSKKARADDELRCKIGDAIQNAAALVAELDDVIEFVGGYGSDLLMPTETELVKFHELKSWGAFVFDHENSSLMNRASFQDFLSYNLPKLAIAITDIRTSFHINSQTALWGAMYPSYEDSLSKAKNLLDSLSNEELTLVRKAFYSDETLQELELAACGLAWYGPPSPIAAMVMGIDYEKHVEAIFFSSQAVLQVCGEAEPTGFISPKTREYDLMLLRIRVNGRDGDLAAMR